MSFTASISCLFYFFSRNQLKIYELILKLLIEFENEKDGKRLVKKRTKLTKGYDG